MESLRNSGDFRELLSRLNGEGARYLVVGGFALAHYGRPRYTKDLDVWIDPCGDNPERVFRALATFGAPLEQLSVDDLRDPDVVFQIGVEPIRIDILSSVTGLDFKDAWENREPSSYAEISVFVLGRDDLIANKRASARPSDLRDVGALLDES